MPRKKKVRTEDQKKLARRLRRSSRRISSDKGSIPESPNSDIQFRLWNMSRFLASQILNSVKDRPYWLSFPWPKDRNGPVCEFYPSVSFWKNGRFYYGFLVRDHRDLYLGECENARKELTGGIDRPLID